MLTSVELGFGGVYALCPPQLLFIPMRDDRPSGPAQVLLDGFTVPTDNMHNFANGLRWGPDGWLYGRCGTSAPGRVAAPGNRRRTTACRSMAASGAIIRSARSSRSSAMAR